MRSQNFYKKCRMFLLWILLIAVLYCWKKPEFYLVLIGVYGIFLILNRYYSYLQEKEEEKQRQGRFFQPQKFYKQYMKKKNSMIKLEVMLLCMMLFLWFLKK